MNEPAPIMRRRILVLREAEYDEASYEAPDLMADAETWIVNWDAVATGRHESRVLERLMASRQLGPDRMFLLSPYDDAYVIADDAEEKFSLRKFELFTSLCSILGAKQVVAQRNDKDQFRDLQEGGVKVDKGGVGVNASASRDLRQRVEQRLSVTTKLRPHEPDVEQAQSLLEEHHLTDDSTMRGLVDLFRRGGRVTSQQLTLAVTSEASREVKAAASLKIPATLTVSSSFRSLRVHEQEVLIDLNVSF